MKKLFQFIIFFQYVVLQAQCPSITIPTGTIGTPYLKESGTYIGTTSSSTVATVSPINQIVKFDVTGSTGYIELNPGFTAAPTNNVTAFIAQPLDGCGGSTPSKVEVDNSPDTNHQVTIYPNPSKAVFYMESKNIGNGLLEIHNLLGMKIFQQDFISDTTTEINLQGLPSQVYFVTITSDNYRSVRRIIKQ